MKQQYDCWYFIMLFFFGSLLFLFHSFTLRLYVCCVEEEKHFIVKKLFWVKLHACKGVLLKFFSRMYCCWMFSLNVFECFIQTLKHKPTTSMKEQNSNKKKMKSTKREKYYEKSMSKVDLCIKFMKSCVKQYKEERNKKKLKTKLLMQQFKVLFYGERRTYILMLNKCWWKFSFTWKLIFFLEKFLLFPKKNEAKKMERNINEKVFTWMNWLVWVFTLFGY